jgi:V8-like Glu-specific endopeptidase
LGCSALFLGSFSFRRDFGNYNDSTKFNNELELSSNIPQIEIDRSAIDYELIESTLNWSRVGDRPLEQTEGATNTVEYDLKTGIERVSSRDETVSNAYPSIIEPFEGIVNPNYWIRSESEEKEGGLQSSYVFPPDDRQEITDTTQFPWSSICKLYIEAQDSSHYIGSGAIVDEFHVLTVGHCLYIHEAGGWAEEIIVVPGMDGSYEPYGVAYATNMRTYEAWIQSESYQHDWGLITLDRSIGNLTGWMGRQTEHYTDPIYSGVLNTAGYPGDLDFGEVMYFCGDNGDRADEYNHWFWMDTAGGQSGSPIWRYNGTHRYILSILAYEYLGGIDANFGTRLNTDKYDQLNAWLAEDSNSTVIEDKADLLDRGIGSTVSRTDLIKGETLFEISCEVANEGTIAASTFDVSFYVSTNTVITEFDYLIGNLTIASLDPYSYTALNWSGVIPIDVPVGSYHVGWIIDSGNDIEEFDESNNDGFLNYPLVEIESPPLPDNSGFLIVAIVVIAVASLVAITVIIVAARSSRRQTREKALRAYESQPYKTSTYQVATSYKPKGLNFCTNCGNKRFPNAKYCVNCGIKFR